MKKDASFPKRSVAKSGRVGKAFAPESHSAAQITGNLRPEDSEEFQIRKARTTAAVRAIPGMRDFETGKRP